ncbi:MAG TPA: DUF3604 domain-containing protein [Caldilineaceae bacterium]|nr:DUF3604 domain-containing protein [Caldilineaceae bacterium]
MLLTSGKPGFPHVWHLPALADEERAARYGQGVVEMASHLTAGEYTTVTFHFTLGDTPLPEGGRLRVAWRWPIDWHDLQTTDPAGDGYVTVTTDQAVGVAVAFQQLGDLDPWMHCLDLQVTAGTLRKGDELHLVCGDRTHGGRGWRAPTCRVNAAHFLLLINPDNSERWLRLADPPSFAVTAGAPTRLVAVAPAEGIVNEPITLLVRGEDRWGNPAPLGNDPLHLAQCASPPTLPNPAFVVDACTTTDNPAVTRYTLHFNEPGDYRLRATLPTTNLQAESNTVRVHAARPSHQLFWGDLHSGQTEVGCGAGTLAEHYQFARDVAGLQFVTHQANDHYITLPLWNHTRALAATFHEPDNFVVFLGCEWSPPTEDGGDRNVIYRDDETRLRRSGRYYTESDPDPEPDLPTASDFHAAFADEPIMVNMHVGGRPTNLDYHLPAIEPLAEIHSTHGTSEWFVMDALRRGYRVGITAGADGVTGRPGADHPGWRLNRNVRSGLTAVYATALTREGLWEAFHARRCYGTNGARIRLWFEVDGQPMGATCATDGQPVIKLAVQGTAAIERVDLLRGTEVLTSWQIARPDAARLRVLWSGTETLGTARAQRVVWDGTLQLTDGAFTDVQPIGLQSADDGVQLPDAHTITWQSATAGNFAGFTVQAVADGDSRLHFTAAPCTFACTLNQVRLAPLVVDAGGVNRRVTIGPAPRPDGPAAVELCYRDTQPLDGEIPYWVRVMQVDQGVAWSSPVYVTRTVQMS